MVDSPSLLILQPYVPEYRVAFFNALQEELGHRGIRCLVAAGSARDNQARRGDGTVLRDGITVRDWSLRLGSRSLRLKLVPIRLLRSSSLVVCELASGSVETSLMLALARGRTAVWGHVRGYVSDSSRLDGALERWQMRRAVRTFAYTPGGAEFAEESGVEKARITIVQNSLDTMTIRAEIAATTSKSVDALRRELNLLNADVACFIGALDKSKRLNMLLDIADNIVRGVPSFRLLVAGSGPLEGWFEQAVETRPHIIFLGRADLRLKAIMARLSRGMLMPGRVGLIAVDSFAMEVPIVTTPWRYHAPEFEYLVDGENAIIAGDDSVEAIAQSTIRLMQDDELHRHLIRGCIQSAERYSLKEMVQRFADGVSLMLPSERR